jgi:hypothetical protein
MQLNTRRARLENRAICRLLQRKQHAAIFAPHFYHQLSLGLWVAETDFLSAPNGLRELIQFGKPKSSFRKEIPFSNNFAVVHSRASGRIRIDTPKDYQQVIPVALFFTDMYSTQLCLPAARRNKFNSGALAREEN